MKTLYKIFPYIYIITVFLTFLYIRSVINVDSMEIKKYEKEENSGIEVKPVKVKLEIYDINDNLTNNFTKRMQNTNTLNDLLESLLSEDLIKFEIVDYIYGSEILNINDIYSNQNYKWKIYENGVDVSDSFEKVKLKDDAVYKLVYTQDK